MEEGGGVLQTRVSASGYNKGDLRTREQRANIFPRRESGRH